MAKKPKYFIVEAEKLPEVFIKVVEAKRMLELREVSTINEAAQRVGISRSAFYKYKDAVMPFNDMMSGHIVTFQSILRDEPGVLSAILNIFAASGANILTINQSIPGNGCAAVTVGAETSGLQEPLDELLRQLNEADGVVQFEVLAG
ncbi:MAG: ACT domain-containing protein [Oscillospiraceae bacterium]|nr:ACT domain-containing protein [Eubacteriales bacterium]MDY2617213.1 ACT domain-containing protein [Oscillospiraceae bacterium]